MKCRLTAGILTGLLLLSPAQIQAEEAAPAHIFWTLEEHVLTITGSGMLDAAEWSPYVDEIYEIRIGEGITGAESRMLSGYPNLQRVELPPGFSVLEPYALADDPQLMEIEGLSHVTSFHYRCLSGTAYIVANPFVITDGRLYYAECTDFSVPEGVTEIMPYAFGNLTGDDFLTYADGIYAAVPVDITLPDGVEIIHENAFAFCAGLTSIRLPDSLREIGDHAFYDCVHLGDIMLGEAVESVGEQAFFNCKSLETLTVLNPDMTFGAEAFGTCLDWNKAMELRSAEQGFTPEQADIVYASTRKALEANPYAMDESMAGFVVHFRETRPYSTISFTQNALISGMTGADYSVQYGTIAGIAGSTAQTFARENALTFVPLDGAPLPGDVNLDGYVDLMDVIRLNKYLLGAVELSDRARLAADCDGIMTVDALDSLRILRCVIGLEIL